MSIEPRSQHQILSGRRFHFLEWGPIDAPPVLILHGFTGHAWQAHQPAQRLADRYRVVALDQRGHGDSDRAEVYGAVPMTDDAVAFLDALGLPRAALVGHSMGGLVATSVAALHPDRVTALVLGDIGPEVAPEGAARIRTSVAAPDVFADVDDAYEQQAALNPTADPVALRQRVEHNLAPCPDGTLTWKWDPALRDGTAQFENRPADELWALLGVVEVPILVLRGEMSDILSVDVARRMLAANARAELVTLPGAGHSIATDVPDLVAAAVGEFLDGLPAA